MAETWIDPIVEEVRKLREEHAAAFDYSLPAIYKDLKAKEASSGRSYVRYSPRPVAVQAQTSRG
jgi:hypothetical protein